MANITIKGNFFNIALTPAVALLIFQAGVRIQDNPPGVIVNSNPFIANDDFTDNIALPAGNYDLIFRGASDGIFVLNIQGDGITLDHAIPANYPNDIADAFVLTIT
jgi:hypothetical protein